LMKGHSTSQKPNRKRLGFVVVMGVMALD